ncbi:vacuolar sorting protein, putative [Ichthyophthirius multifiliis]|uniref:Vacuolar sorting protein, putative n=1 Tax=Ichthyophthirius multifiliis TaxID=5932 RepID=G0QX53_ICHMU|nr:vacuolar sorting protein, putative [Ichthyophthirius multifiliis]EGR30199.1 vacuolar sorting protein, putative [Ichthyophthirius multifiliis]|eukprot:XP_004031795.1 vacuolar sorting protein, putative [Ichthyophthirius multifiliis]
MQKQYTLDTYKIAEDYFDRMLQEVTGIKCLVLDEETVQIISLVYSQTSILKKDVYLIERIDQPSEGKMQHLKVIYFIRPTEQNQQRLLQELEKSRFAEYYIFFSNSASNLFIETIAQADNLDLIKQIHEIYIDYYILSSHLYSLNVTSTYGLTKQQPLWNQTDNQVLQRVYEGLLSVLLSLKRVPMIKYLSSSDACLQLASKLTKKLKEEQQQNMSQLGQDSKTLLLIWDRREDPITPLLNQWTYQAMLHEIIGLQNNRIDIERKQKAIGDVNNVSSGNQDKEFVLNEKEDQFFMDNMYENFGDMTSNIRNFVESIQLEKNKSKKMETLQDIQNIVDSLPELKKKSNNLNKHFTLSMELNNTIEQQELMEISKAEQEISTKEARNDQANMIFEILNNKQIPKYQKLKLVIMYALRYENEDKIGKMKEKLKELGLTQTQTNLINHALDYAGKQHRSGDLFSTKNTINKYLNKIKNVMKDVPNVFTQHKPYIINIINQILENQMKENEFATTDLNFFREQPKEIIVFILGGATYEEAREIAMLHKEKSINALIGGTFVHNSYTFLAEIRNIAKDKKDEFGVQDGSLVYR